MVTTYFSKLNDFPFFFYIFNSPGKSIHLLVSNGSSIIPLPCLISWILPEVLFMSVTQLNPIHPPETNENVPPSWWCLSLFSNLKGISVCHIYVSPIICLLSPYKILLLTTFWVCCCCCFFLFFWLFVLFLHMISANWLALWRKLWLLFVNIQKTLTLLPSI